MDDYREIKIEDEIQNAEIVADCEFELEISDMPELPTHAQFDRACQEQVFRARHARKHRRRR